MDKKSKILIVGFIILIMISIGFTYSRAFVDQDFEIVGFEDLELEEIAE